MKNGSQTEQTPLLFKKGDEVWDLLGASDVETPCDMFSRKVMHSIRTQTLKKNWFETLLHSWGFAFASGSTAACALLAFLSNTPNQTSPNFVETSKQENNLNYALLEEDIPAELIPVYSFDEVTELDTENLIAAIENPRSTTDSELVDLLF